MWKRQVSIRYRALSLPPSLPPFLPSSLPPFLPSSLFNTLPLRSQTVSLHVYTHTHTHTHTHLVCSACIHVCPNIPDFCVGQRGRVTFYTHIYTMVLRSVREAQSASASWSTLKCQKVNKRGGNEGIALGAGGIDIDSEPLRPQVSKEALNRPI